MRARTAIAMVSTLADTGRLGEALFEEMHDPESVRMAAFTAEEAAPRSAHEHE